jgi:hypothetical protein
MVLKGLGAIVEWSDVKIRNKTGVSMNTYKCTKVLYCSTVAKYILFTFSPSTRFFCGKGWFYVKDFVTTITKSSMTNAPGVMGFGGSIVNLLTPLFGIVDL